MTAEDVAQWMVKQLGHGYLYQHVVAFQIKSEFGDEFVYWNENHNLAISRPVLQAFRKLTGDTVVWERGQRCWRERRSYDPPNSRQS
jgi:hypothetical protein